VGNKENEYLFLTPIKQLINVTKEPGDDHKKKKKKKNPQRGNLGRNHWEMNGEDTIHG
jgi:hypothetical protein